VTDLQTCITLSQRCVAAVDREVAKPGSARKEIRDLMTRRDDLARTLTGDDMLVFRRWANGRMTDDEITALLATDEAS
jgi:hypothetical protein